MATLSNTMLGFLQYQSLVISLQGNLAVHPASLWVLRSDTLYSKVNFSYECITSSIQKKVKCLLFLGKMIFKLIWRVTVLMRLSISNRGSSCFVLYLGERTYFKNISHNIEGDDMEGHNCNCCYFHFLLNSAI